MHLLIDSDILCYRSGFVNNLPEQEELACWQVGDLVRGAIAETGAETYQCYLSGSNNFRYKVYQDYKANRKDVARPLHLQAMRAFLVEEFGAVVSDGIEADDMLGIAQCGQEDTCIASIDKDLLQIPGKHYNYVTKQWRDVSNESAMRHFFYQLIMGDRADNILGFDGKMRDKVPQKFQHHIDALNETNDFTEQLTYVFAMYNEDWERFNMNARCLWIQRVPYDEWTDWQDPVAIEELKSTSENNIMVENGQPDDSILLSHPF